MDPRFTAYLLTRHAQLYSEELINACFTAVKNQLEMVVYPFVESTGDPRSRLLRHVVQPASRGSNCRRQLAELFQALEAAIPRINDLVNADRLAMSEGIIIQVVYIAIGPFFVVEHGGENEGKGKKESAVLNTLGSSAMRGLRLDALALIRSVSLIDHVEACIELTTPPPGLRESRRATQLDHRRDPVVFD